MPERDLKIELFKLQLHVSTLTTALNFERNRPKKCDCKHDSKVAWMVPVNHSGDSPIVQYMPESHPTKMELPDGRRVDVALWALDANGESWPMVRSEESQRPIIMRGFDDWKYL